jgi:hypothetical protein
MKVRLAMAALAVALSFSAVTARADVVDMSSITCNDLVKFDHDEATIVLVWLHGYFGGEARDTKLDIKALENAADQLGRFREKGSNQQTTLFAAIKKLFR